MSDQKNKQQQPSQGNEKNQGKSGQPQGNQQQDKQQTGSQHTDKQPQASSQQSGGQQSGGKQSGGQQSGDQHSAGKQQQPHKGSMADTGREQPMGSDIENPDRDNEPGKKVNIDDDPEQTKKKVPNMGK